MLTKAQEYLQRAQHAPDCNCATWNKTASLDTKEPPPQCNCGLEELKTCFEGTYEIL
jgi:hypothetical protein